MERPFTEVFESGKPDFPFMLCWANENWSRNWDGGNKEILIEQEYSEADDRLHIQSLIPYFKDQRYIKVDGKPVFAVYRSSAIPNMSATIKTWREEAAKHGLELYICRFESCLEGGKEYLDAGFDAAIDFQPWGRQMCEYKEIIVQKKMMQFNQRLKRFFYKNIAKKLSESAYKNYKTSVHNKIIRNNIFGYNDYINYVISKPAPGYKVFPGVTPIWDNTARQTQNPGIAVNANPGSYKLWLQHVVKTFQPFSKEENFVFINAWNEWAEGCHLEPCVKWGKQFLEVTKDVLSNENQ